MALDVMRDTLTWNWARWRRRSRWPARPLICAARFATASTTHNAAALVLALRGLATVLDTTGQWEPARAAEAEAAEVERLLNEALRSVGFVSPLAPPEVARRRRRSSCSSGPHPRWSRPTALAPTLPGRGLAGRVRDLDKAARRLAREDGPGWWS